MLASCNGCTDRNANEAKRALTGSHNLTTQMCHIVAGGCDVHSALADVRSGSDRRSSGVWFGTRHGLLTETDMSGGFPGTCGSITAVNPVGK